MYRWLKLIYCTGNAIGIVRCRRNREIYGIHEIVVVERILVDRIAKELEVVIGRLLRGLTAAMIVPRVGSEARPESRIWVASATIVSAA